MRITRWMLAGAVCCFAQAALGAELPQRVLACAAESDNARRLACYDREVGTGAKPAAAATAAPPAPTQAAAASAPPSATAPTAAAVAPAAATATAAAAAAPTAAAVPTPAQEFGVEGSEVARKREQETKKAGGDIDEITATVTKVSKQPRGELTISLDNGHVWRQKTAESYFPLEVGDNVRIRRGTLGSYRLTNPAGRTTQVTRVE